jgi:hypothetical protein
LLHGRNSQNKDGNLASSRCVGLFIFFASCIFPGHAIIEQINHP